MGYTLVTAFENAFYESMNKLLADRKTNKIPFGRDCDRDSANRVMKYHMTLVHWAKAYDSLYLPKASKLVFKPFKIRIIGTSVLLAEEGSALLYFNVEEGEGFSSAARDIQTAMGIGVSSFYHITIAVSHDHEYIDEIKRIVDGQFSYPFELNVTGLDLYHIWRPVRLENSYLSDACRVQ